MTTSAPALRAVNIPAVDARALEFSQLRVLRSEWTKFYSLRSTVYTLLVAVLLTLGLGVLLSAVSSPGGESFGPNDAVFDPITVSLNGITFSQLAFGVLGVLLTASEYSTGMIRSSLTTVPKRLPVLWGKLAVFAGIALVVGLATTFASFVLGQVLLGDDGVSLSADGALRSVVGAALYLSVVGMIGVALGALLRNTAAGISTFVAIFFVMPPLSLLLPDDLSGFVKYLPSNAGGALYGGAGAADGLAPWTGFAVVCGYAVIMIAAAAYWLRRRDA